MFLFFILLLPPLAGIIQIELILFIYNLKPLIELGKSGTPFDKFFFAILPIIFSKYLGCNP